MANLVVPFDAQRAKLIDYGLDEEFVAGLTHHFIRSEIGHIIFRKMARGSNPRWSRDAVQVPGGSRQWLNTHPLFPRTDSDRCCTCATMHHRDRVHQR